jgi:cysteinyl-tRNA synthetase, unknown class
MTSFDFFTFHRSYRKSQACGSAGPSVRRSSPFVVPTLAAAVIAVLGVVALVANPAAAQRSAPTPTLRNLDTPRKFDSAPEARAQQLRPVRNWGYWLSSFAINDVVTAPHDLMVVDNGVSANRRFMRQRTRDEVARMKQRPNGSPRLLLAYLSIGEAERYRAYWRPEWYDRKKKPTWLGPANPEWDGNYFVQFWAPEWQALMFGKPESYLDIIMAQGFDGVYLDRADAFAYWEKTRPSAQKDMTLFLRRLSTYARQRNPEFLIVMQNAEELLDDAKVLESIDGIAKEDLFFGVEKHEAPNEPEDVAFSLKQLRLARDAGRKVLVVEYLNDPVKISATAKLIVDEGFLPYFAPRLLDCLNPPAVPFSAAAGMPSSCR